MAINLKGKFSYPKKIFTAQEIRYLLDLSHDLKGKRRAGICEPMLKEKISRCFLKKHPPELDAHLKSLLIKKAPT